MEHKIPTPEIGSVIKITLEGWKKTIECRVKARTWSDQSNEYILTLDSPEVFTAYTQDSLVHPVQRADIHLSEQIILKRYEVNHLGKCHIVITPCTILR